MHSTQRGCIEVPKKAGFYHGPLVVGRGAVKKESFGTNSGV